MSVFTSLNHTITEEKKKKKKLFCSHYYMTNPSFVQFGTEIVSSFTLNNINTRTSFWELSRISTAFLSVCIIVPSTSSCICVGDYVSSLCWSWSVWLSVFSLWGTCRMQWFYLTVDGAAVPILQASSLMNSKLLSPYVSLLQYIYFYVVVIVCVMWYDFLDTNDNI